MTINSQKYPGGTSGLQPSPICHSFPPDFPVDDQYLSAALDEFNFRYSSNKAFPDLSAEERLEVVNRAQELKDDGRRP
jgi:hypothetical protein